MTNLTSVTLVALIATAYFLYNLWKSKSVRKATTDSLNMLGIAVLVTLISIETLWASLAFTALLTGYIGWRIYRAGAYKWFREAEYIVGLIVFIAIHFAFGDTKYSAFLWVIIGFALFAGIRWIWSQFHHPHR